jgi:hypothetical protein
MVKENQSSSPAVARVPSMLTASLKAGKTILVASAVAAVLFRPGSPAWTSEKEKLAAWAGLVRPVPIVNKQIAVNPVNR